MLAFLDVEASSLMKGSFPIEVAVAFEDGSEICHLIRPRASWTELSYASESIHGISREVLAAEGGAADDVARRLVQVLGGCEVYAYAPWMDAGWLYTLTKPARIPVEHVGLAYKHALTPLGLDLDPAHPGHSLAVSLARSLLMQADTEARAAVPQRHRAAPDARRLFWTWRRLEQNPTIMNRLRFPDAARM